MDLSWILLALFLIALIRGVIKAMGRSMVKNVMRLCSVTAAFLVALGLQIWGIFQSIANTIISSAMDSLVEYVDIRGMLDGVPGADKIVFAFLSTIIGMMIFIIAFFIILNIFSIVAYYVSRIFLKLFPKKEKPVETSNAEESTSEAKESTSEAKESNPRVEANTEYVPLLNSEARSEITSITEVATDTKDESETTAITEEVSEVKIESITSAEEPKSDKKKPKKEKNEKKKAGKKKPTEFFADCAWKRAISIATGIISSLLVFAILLMPIFYIMNAALMATDALKDTDATDSQIYKILDIADDYVVDSYRHSFVYGFYNAIAVDDLMNYTAKMGGRITLDDGRVVYSDDLLKGLLTHGISAAMQLTSENSECKDVAEDVKAVVSNPAVSTVLADLLTSYIADIEIEEAEETDLIGGLINNFIEIYKNADKATIEKDISALGEVFGVLAEKKLLAAVVANNVDFEEILEDKQILSDTVEAISGLSAFGPTVEGAFELGVEVLGETLMIPADDAAAYEIFIDDILDSMIKDKDAAFDSKFNAAAYVNYCITENKPISSYKALDSYVKQWKKVQAAFAHASEDKSYGSFTIEVNGKLYVEDGGYMVAYTDAYKDKVSPIAGIINELTRTSAGGKLSIADLYARLEAYLASSRASGASAELARGILAPDSFITKSVTLEKMMASTRFDDWTDEEKRNDSRLCVDIIVDLLDLVDSLENMSDKEGISAAYDLVDQFVTLGKTMDTMKQTSCISGLPELLLEGLIKHDVLSAYMKPAVVFAINDLVENNDKSYADCMSQIADQIRFAISTVGGEQK